MRGDVHDDDAYRTARVGELRRGLPVPALLAGGDRARHRASSPDTAINMCSSAPRRPIASRCASCRSPKRRRFTIRTGTTRGTRPRWSASFATRRTLPFTIVRPSHTYRTKMPTPLGGEVSQAASRQAGRRAWRRRIAVDDHARARLRTSVRSAAGELATRSEKHFTSRTIGNGRGTRSSRRLRRRSGSSDVDDGARRERHAVSATTRSGKARSSATRARRSSSTTRKVKRVVGDFDCPIDPWIGMRIVAESYPPTAAFDAEKGRAVRPHHRRHLSS